MKKKIILDLLFYLGIPLLIWNCCRGYMGDYYAIFWGTVPALIYTVVDFFRSREFNVSGLFLMIVMILNFIFNIISKLDIISKTAEEAALREMWSGIYVSLILTVLYVISMAMRKPIGMYFFIDYAYAKGIPRKTSFERFSQKKYLRYFQLFTLFLTSRELIVIVVKSIMINSYGLKGFNTIQIVMQVISYAFVGVTVLIVMRILKQIRKPGEVTTPIVVPD